MKQNVGLLDKRVRTALGAVFGTVSLLTLFGGVGLPLPALAAPVLGIIALVMLGTAATGTCPAYSLLGVDTCPAQIDEAR